MKRKESWAVDRRFYSRYHIAAENVMPQRHSYHDSCGIVSCNQGSRLQRREAEDTILPTLMLKERDKS